jgi:hypothetical protein
MGSGILEIHEELFTMRSSSGVFAAGNGAGSELVGRPSALCTGAG